MSDKPEYAIIANMTGDDRTFRSGAKCWLVNGTGGEGWGRFGWYGLSIGGRRIEKWSDTRNFENFRAAWVTPFVRQRYPWLYYEGTRGEMEQLAERLNHYRATATAS